MAKSQDSDNRNNSNSKLIAQFLENQSKELENATQEIKFKELNEKNAFKYASKALEAQKEDRREERDQLTLFMKYGFWLTVLVLLLMSVFVAGCIYTNNINIIVSILKVIAYVLPSAIGGYFIGLNRRKKSSRDTHSTYAEVVED
ncbi:MAG: YrzE family protein [Ekhidna sp.]|nr:YrzE family protein [Ekhidna sp.]MBC6426954.1 YrzE family protein [Ekhidna sp.]